jgi:hypothetical protein
VISTDQSYSTGQYQAPIPNAFPIFLSTSEVRESSVLTGFEWKPESVWTFGVKQ